MYVYIYIQVFHMQGFFWQTRGMYNLLRKRDSHVKVYLKEEIPDIFLSCNSNRIQHVILVAEEALCVYVCVQKVIGQILGRKIHS